ncbi:MAG TPA: hypothetical protein VM409_08810 [Chloroflexia bacterium]|nr:hypothetical protein [Chloroflexia bacterium]
MVEQTIISSEDRSDQHHASHETALKMRVDFAERAFINSLELSRFMDLKANYLLSAVALLTAALGIVASKTLDVRPAVDWQVWLKGVGLVSFMAYVVTAFLVIYNATRVFRASSSLLPGESQAPGLIFPLSVIGQFKAETKEAEEQYFSTLNRIQPHDILRDYANQILEVSSIYKFKHNQINRSLDLFRMLTIFWIVTMVIMLALIVLH